MDLYNPKGVCKCNEYIKPYTVFDPDVTDPVRSLLQEAQTSGGLLVLIHPDQADKACEALRQGGDPHTTVIGHATALQHDVEEDPVYLKVTT